MSTLASALAVLLVCAMAPGTLELLLLSMAGCFPARARSKTRRTGQEQRVRSLGVVVPAHDEERLVERCVKSLRAMTRGDFELRILVVADNCTDETAELARRAGAQVLERIDAQQRGKGHALELAFKTLLAEGVEALAVVDADSEVSPDFALAVVERLRSGADGVQVRYALSNAAHSVKTRLVDVAWNAFNLLRPRGRDRLGLSCGILGNGFALSARSLSLAPYLARSIVEDLEHHLALVQGGQRVEFEPAACVRAETPTHAKGLKTQRTRWEGGRLKVARQELPRLAKALVGGRGRVLEPMADLCLLPLSFHAAVCTALALGFSGWPHWAGVVGLAVLALHVLATLLVLGAGPGHWLALVLAPCYVLWKLSLLPAIALAGRSKTNWQRTQREAGGREAGALTVGYLVNQYPKISHAWITREIDGVEASGVRVERFSIRDAGEPEVNPRDAQEKRRTQVLWRGGAKNALAAGVEVCAVFVSRPLRCWAAAREAAHMGRGSNRGLLLHFFYLAEACLFLRRLRAAGVSHVHAHFGTNSATVAALCHVLGGPTFSFTMHGPEMLTLAGTNEIRRKIALARFVVAISHHGRGQLYRETAFHAWRKIALVRCGADELFLDQPAVPLDAKQRLVCVGRLSPEKGHLTLLDALATVAREGPAFQVELIGDGELRPLIEARIRELGLEQHVFISGWKGSHDVKQAILRSRAMVLASYEEGLPVVFMESLALRRPVISTYVAGIPEIVLQGQTGWLVPAASVEALSVALRELLLASDEQLCALGNAGHDLVARQHDSRLEARKLALLFRGDELEQTSLAPRPLANHLETAKVHG